MDLLKQINQVDNSGGLDDMECNDFDKEISSDDIKFNDNPDNSYTQKSFERHFGNRRRKLCKEIFDNRGLINTRLMARKCGR